MNKDELITQHKEDLFQAASEINKMHDLVDDTFNRVHFWKKRWADRNRLLNDLGYAAFYLQDLKKVQDLLQDFYPEGYSLHSPTLEDFLKDRDK